MNEAIERAIEANRAEQNRPSAWIHLTEAEMYQLLAGVVPESVKLNVYALTNEAHDARMIQNAEKPTPAMKHAARRKTA